MKAIIMAAGIGSRLRPLTNDKSKCLLELGNKNLIDRQIEMLRKNGIYEIIVVTGYKSKMIENKFINDENIKIVFNPFYKITNVIGSLWFGKRYLDSTFIFLHCDTIFEESILKDLLAKRGDMVLAVDFKECDAEDMKVSIKDNKIKIINKEIEPENASGEFIGLVKISENVISDLNKIIDNYIYDGEFNHFFEVVIQEIIDKYENYNVDFIETKGRFWCEIDSKKEYDNAREYFEKGENK